MTKQEHLLVILSEECAELSKEASKALRFGLNDHEPEKTETNAQRIVAEFNDLCVTGSTFFLNLLIQNMKYKILNLYACLGGNRYKWDEVADIEVTAVELDPELARMYQERFPNDIVIIADAHQYLLDHYKEFDFIWTSPPCPSHSKVRFTQKNTDFYIPIYPEMSLYQEIIFLKHHFEGLWLTENVTPYYEPLVPGKKIGRHIYWSNFMLPNSLHERSMKGIMCGQENDELTKLCKFHEIDLSTYKGEQRKDKIARNLVDYEVGKSILERALNVQRQNKCTQALLF